MIDSHTLKKNEDFDKLPNLYIIFILEHDLFNRGNPIYFVNKTLDIKDEEGQCLPFNDGCNIMYVNGDYRGDDALGKLMHDFSTPNADEMYYSELAKKVRFHKQDDKGVQMASQIVEEYGDERTAEAFKNGHEQGIAEGAQQKAVETAIKMLRNEYPVSKISEMTGLPQEQILELEKQITVPAEKQKQ